MSTMCRSWKKYWVEKPHTMIELINELYNVTKNQKVRKTMTSMMIRRGLASKPKELIASLLMALEEDEQALTKILGEKGIELLKKEAR